MSRTSFERTLLSDGERREPAPLLRRPGFGRTFSDHMVVACWSGDRGWHGQRIMPYQDLSLAPSAMVFHYGQAIFEGLKAYRMPDSGIGMFRPEENARRFHRSAVRMAMPPLGEDLFVDACVELVLTDRDWVPSQPGQSLYLRPFMIATEAALGVRPAREYMFVVIASPSDPFFSAEPTPIRTWISTDYSRAAPGGTGAAKCAGNYAASLAAHAQAIAAGCDQVIWLDACERRWVEELGGMNVYFVKNTGDGRPLLLTPPLSETILAGITRDSIAVLANDFGYEVQEARIDVNDLLRGCERGEIVEAFACGTAAVIAPIGELHTADGVWTVADGQPGKITMTLRQALLDIQHGLAEDPHGWMRRLA